MRKNYLAVLSVIVMAVSFSFNLTSCIQKNESGYEMEEDDEYDGPGKAIEFEIERTKDPVTGKVPWDQFLVAKLQTQTDRMRSSNRINALSWVERGPDGDVNGPSGNPRPNADNTAGRIRAAMVDSLDPSHNTVWVGGVDGGLWKTTDITASPASWTLVNDFLSNLAVAAICQDPRPGFQNFMYFCTGESFGNADAVQGVGVFKSVDAGNTWSFLPSTAPYVRGTRIVCDYQGNVYLGTRGNGLLRSTDGGTSWTDITPSGMGTSICDIEISSTSSPGRLHVASGIFSTSTYRFTDDPANVSSGSGWNSATTPYTTFNQRTELAVSGNVLFALPSNGSYQVPTIWKSTDGGDNWTATTGQPTTNWASGQAWYSLSVGINPSNSNEVIVGGLDCYKTLNGGNSWSKISTWASSAGQYVHADQHNIQWWDNGSKLMFTCDGGVHFSSNGGATIRDRNKGLRLKQFYSVAIHPTQTNYFLAGAQDNGVHRLDHPGLDSSVEITGGDGCYVAIDQNEPQYQFGSYVYNVYRRSTNNGQNWSTPVNNQSSGRFVNPWDYDNDANIIYACNANGSYFRWNNPQTGSTTNIVSLPSLSGHNVSAVHASPYTSNRVFFGTGNGRVIRVDDADGATPTDVIITPSGSAGYVNCVVTGSSDQNLIACYSSYNVMNVWVSNDGGTSWTGIDGNLPNMPVRWALFHPDTDTKAFIATETGVWETDLINGSSTIWNANNTFPNVRTDMIKYRASDRTIAAGTHGRGVWSATIPAPSGFSFASPSPATTSCPAPASMDISLGTIANGGFSNTISLSATGNPPGTTVSFIPANTVLPGNNVTVRLNNTNLLTIGSYTITVTGTASGAPTQTRDLTYTITSGSGPVISTQPANQTACAGTGVSFSVVATGTFQWQTSTNGGITWGNIGGATSNIYSIASVSAVQNANQYRCIVSNNCGSTTSNAAVLTVNSAPSISVQPQATTACTGGGATFSVTASGTNISYQWELSTNGGTTYNPISGATSSNYAVTGATLGMNGYLYRCVISGLCTPASVTSSAATLTVITSLSITGQPVDVVACEGDNASFTVTAVGATGYQWQLSTDGGTTYNNISGATSTTFTITGVALGANGNKYRCALSSPCGNANSTAATLTVNSLPAISVQPQSITLCAGANTTFSITASGTGISYQWQESLNGCAGPWNNIVGATSSSYSLTGLTAGMDNKGYRCVVSGTCTPAAISNCALLNVVTSVNVTLQPISTTICDGTNTSYTVAGSGAGIIYQWQVNTGSGYTNISNGGVYSGATSATLNITGANTTMNGYQYRCQLSNATCTTPGVSNTAVLTVNSLPSISSNPVNQTICLGGNTSFSVSAAGTGITYQWQVNDGSGFVNISNTGVYSGATTNTLTITGATLGMNNYQYKCIVSGTCTPVATSTVATLIVYAPVAITSSPSDVERCSGTDATFVVAGNSVPQIIYQWQVSTDGGTSWTNIAGANAASYTVAGVIIVMNNNRYRCLLSSATCTAPAVSGAATLTVRQLPTVGLSAAPLTSLLPGQSTTLTATPSATTGGVLAITWTQNGSPITVNGNTLPVTVANLGAYQVGIRETWPSSLFCASLSQIVTIDATISNKLFIFPSPNDGNFTVSYYNNSGNSTQRQIVIYDSKGAMVFDRKFTITGPYTLIPVNLQRANTGIYHVVVGDSNGMKLAEGKVHVR